MNKLRWMTILIVGTLFLSACTTATPLSPTAAPTAIPQETVESIPTQTPEPTATQMLQATATPNADNNETMQNDVDAEAVTEILEPINIPDRLLMDFEVVYYQSDFISDTTQLSQVFENGKPTVLVFWAGLCPICRREMPEIQAAYEQYGDQVNFIGIDVGLFTNLGSKDDAIAMMEELNLTYPLGATLDFNVMREYEITAIPTTLFMKPDGQILRKESTLLSEDALLERIDTLLEFSES